MLRLFQMIIIANSLQYMRNGVSYLSISILRSVKCLHDTVIIDIYIQTNTIANELINSGSNSEKGIIQLAAYALPL